MHSLIFIDKANRIHYYRLNGFSLETLNTQLLLITLYLLAKYGGNLKSSKTAHYLRIPDDWALFIFLSNTLH
jgi:hypothetical protein